MRSPSSWSTSSANELSEGTAEQPPAGRPPNPGRPADQTVVAESFAVSFAVSMGTLLQRLRHGELEGSITGARDAFEVASAGDE